MLKLVLPRFDHESTEKSTVKSWTAQFGLFPWACHLLEGGYKQVYKQVYKVYNSFKKINKAVAVMDLVNTQE